MNEMFDLMQLVVSTITTETHVEHLAKLSIDNIVLLFGMFKIIVINSNSLLIACSKICSIF